MLPLLLAMGIGPFLSWKRADLGGVMSRLTWIGCASLLVVAGAWYAQRGGPILAALAFGLSAWLLLATLQDWAMRVRLGREPLGQSLRRIAGMPRAAHGMALAHAGIAVCVMGFVGSTLGRARS